MFGGGKLLQQNLTADQKSSGYSVGLDPSLTSFGVYCLPLKHEEWYGWSLQSIAKDGSDTLRVMALVNEVTVSMAQLPYPVKIAVFEDYGPINRTSGKIAQRAEMCGILKSHFLLQLKVPVVTVPPNALKSFATGNGRASKEQMLDEANKRGYYPDTHDEADAFFAARLGMRILQGGRIGVAYMRTNP